MPQEPLKSMKKNTGTTHDLPTVTVTSKLDPKLKAYQDSLTLYNLGKDYNKKVYNINDNKLGFQLFESSYKGWNKNDIIKNEKSDLKNHVVSEDDMKKYKWDTNDIKIQRIYNDLAKKALTTGNVPVGSYSGEGYFPAFKKPTQPVKYQKPQDILVETIKKDIPSTSLSIMKKPEVVVQKQNNYDEGESIMLPIPSKLGGGGGAFIGTKKKDGTIEYVKPEDFKRMGVPPYGQEFILNQLAKKDEK